MIKREHRRYLSLIDDCVFFSGKIFNWLRIDEQAHILETGNGSVRCSAMNRLQRLLALTDRVLMNLENNVPPETLVTIELREILDEMKIEANKDSHCAGVKAAQD